MYGVQLRTIRVFVMGLMKPPALLGLLGRILGGDVALRALRCVFFFGCAFLRVCFVWQAERRAGGDGHAQVRPPWGG